MTVVHTPDPALPVGADPDVFEAWDEDSQRVVWSHPMSLPERLADSYDIRVGVVQRHDGTIISEGDDSPVIFLNGDEMRSPADARALVEALTEAADLADQWTGKPGLSPIELMADAFSALRAARVALLSTAGDAADHLQIALDAVNDAAEVLR
ncbi:hypothetical protein [Mycolicibacter sinensis]